MSAVRGPSGVPHPGERMPLFMTGWRYVSTEEEADTLPQGAVAIVDDGFLWDSIGSGPIVPNLNELTWDGVVDVQERDFIHECDGGGCDRAGCRYVWNETGDTRDSPRPPLPFFAWHPTFCTEATDA